jgi:hypothetical protein
MAARNAGHTEVVPKGTTYNMVVSAERAATWVKDGVPPFGMWATTDAVSSQAFARNTLAITSEMKSDVSYLIRVETTEAQIISKGFAGAVGTAKGTGSQVQFEEWGKLKVVGNPELLPVK